MKEFKIGDKVKIPKTKHGQPNPEKMSVCVRQVLEKGQDFLYIVKIYDHVISLRHIYTPREGGDFFMLSEIELYEKVEETETFIPLGIKNNGKDIFLVSEKDGTSSLQYKSN